MAQIFVRVPRAVKASPAAASARCLMEPALVSASMPPLDLAGCLVQDAPVTKDEALKQLEDAEVVPCVSAGIADIKEVFDACLAADIPAVLDRQEGCSPGHGCGTRIDLCVRTEDLPKVMRMMHLRWQSLLDQEGTLDEVAEGTPAKDDDPPCPACGAPGPLVDGACKECGLQLE
jgi:hypothetical protein